MCAAARVPDNGGPSDERSDRGPSEHGPAMYPPPLSLPSTEFRPEPPWRASRQAAAGSNAVTTVELGQKLIVAVPPAPPERSLGAKMWLLGAALIAGSVGGYMGGYIRQVISPQPPSPVTEAEHAVPATEPVASSETARAPTSMPHLTVAAAPVLRADEPAPLTMSYWDAGLNVSVVVDGLAPGSALGAGIPAGPNAWRLSGADLERAGITPPHGFVGVMNLTLELRLADGTVVDRKSLQLEWSGESAPAATASVESSRRHLDASEITLLMKRGAEFVANRDISAARLIFQRAAEAGDAAAAFALAETYDPLALEKLGAIGGAADAARARQWYEKAAALGSAAAPERLIGLTR